MKIDISHIVADHLRTLRSDGESKTSTNDVLVFIVIPITLAIITAYLYTISDKQVYTASISIYAIFIPLLLNIQMAIFSIFIRKWDESDDKNLQAIIQEKLEQKRQLLKELNINLSYLVIFCSFSVTIFFILYTLDITGRAGLAITVAIYIHFITTLLMIVKRSHALFQKEYEES